MDAAEALTVMPRSLSTARVSRMVISSLLSFLLTVLLSLKALFVTLMDDDAADDSSDITDNEDLLLPGILLPAGKSSSSSAGVVSSSPPLLSYFSSLPFPNWYAVPCLSGPRLPVYSSIRDAKLDFP